MPRRGGAGANPDQPMADANSTSAAASVLPPPINPHEDVAIEQNPAEGESAAESATVSDSAPPRGAAGDAPRGWQ